MSVPLQDPTREIAALRDRLDEAVGAVVESGRFVLGPAVASFEEALADRLGVEHAVGVASGTDALALALEAAGVGEGDEVVTPPFSFFATAEAILRVGARPVFADVRPDTLNLDPEAAAGAVTGRTAALLPVHLYGQTADMPALGELADRHDLVLVEDAAQAVGAAQATGGPDAAWPDGATGLRPAADREPRAAGGSEGRGPVPGEGDGSGPHGEVVRAGAAGDAGCFSFYPTKNLSAWGDGGMVTTDDADLAARLRSLRDHGRTPAGGYGHERPGYNSRLDALQAAVLETKLDRLERWNERRREHARRYERALEEVPGVEPPAARPGNVHAFHQFTVRARDREALADHLEARGIGHAVYYPTPLHLQPGLEELGHRAGDFPVAERAAREVLSLPVFPLLEEEEVAAVADALRSFGG